MDYYSQFPAPPYKECKKLVITDVRLRFLQNSPKDPVWDWNPSNEEIDAIVAEAFIDSNVFEDNNDPNPKIKYSYSGWCAFGKSDVMTSCATISGRKKREKLKRKIRGVLLTSYLLIKAHKQTMERMYHPDSLFVNNVLKADFESIANLPPPPPVNTN